MRSFSNIQNRKRSATSALFSRLSQGYFRSQDLRSDTIHPRLRAAGPLRHYSEPTPRWALCRTYLEQIAGSDTAEPACLRLRCNTPCIHNRVCTHSMRAIHICTSVCVQLRALRTSHGEAERHVHRMRASSIAAQPIVAR